MPSTTLPLLPHSLPCLYHPPPPTTSKLFSSSPTTRSLTCSTQEVRGRVLCTAHSGGRKLGAGMEVDGRDMSLGAMANGTAAAGDGDGDEKQKQISPKLLTLVIVKKGEKVLLGMKKRGFGAGYFNGFGGKVEAGETIYEAAVRELQEESGIVPVSMEKRGILTFHFDDNPQPWEVHVYHVGDYTGEPCETEEMAPRWFPLADIPYDKMWQDDPIWYPEFIRGRLFKGEFYFHNTHTLVSHTLHVLQKLDA
ncbi:hypothetical protein KC19_VG331000 [Ceratodon purpureus]|uniref:Oxidized purine nucleoside triphosphate hydrolase n=1 Tax=Ceratodon purpureus TaxID=3225 RepID=A0A8T0HY11_CERPU|nr:hypothetical protein KC19_VG331000 [Ceratodon purpureus]